ncbi:hypothetical protein [Fictibacillus terranigra]|uniref:Uncharacterized protein n=1 Tax=Fictibacillus terranigra TaxID=3058424 RepID=A0ABT8E4J6_9BACL|nr:hypothetical protein [Fictibacillus sp. CENA-BCM004]MDN4072824.1 hypothetical protein [Fictibacillus sp. CENA-BCM004]
MELSFPSTSKGIEDLHSSIETNAGAVSRYLYDYGIGFTAILSVTASLLALALVQDRGRKVPNWLLLTPACMGGSFFIYNSLVTLYKMLSCSIRLSENREFDPWVLLLMLKIQEVKG